MAQAIPDTAAAAAAPRRSAVEWATETLVLGMFLLLVVGFLYASFRGTASKGRSHDVARDVLSLLGGAGGNRLGECTQDEQHEIMALAKQAKRSVEMARHGGLKGWLQHFIEAKKRKKQQGEIVEPTALPASPPPPPLKQGVSIGWTVLTAALAAAAVLRRMQQRHTPRPPPL